MGKHIIHEAKRCLQCKKPQCVAGCPVSTNIPGMIDLLLKGQINDAGKTLFENNPLTLICSLVCTHEKQCEGHCILGKKSSPVQVSAIEHYISDYANENLDLYPIEKKKGNVAIVGSGPAGITIAFLMALRGYGVTLFEANEKIGGVLRYGIPEFRLPKSILDRLQTNLVKLGVRIRPNTLVGQTITLDELFRDGFQAVFIGTGVWKPNKMNIPGEALGHVHFAIDYLRNPDVYELGKHVVVIGAGNVAMDVARTALRNGSKHVTIVNRRGELEMPARTYEIEYAKIDGVQFEHYKVPHKIDQDYVYCHRAIVDQEGLRVDENSTYKLEANSVIVAVSQGPKANIVQTAKELQVSQRGLVVVDALGHTTMPGVFASGDVVTGAKTVVDAVQFSKQVAQEMSRFIDAQFDME